MASQSVNLPIYVVGITDGNGNCTATISFESEIPVTEQQKEDAVTALSDSLVNAGYTLVTKDVQSVSTTNF